MRRGRLCAAAPLMRARAHTCRHSLARGHGYSYGCAEERFDIYDIRYIYIFYTYIRIYWNRSGLCMRVSVRVLMDRLDVRMRWWARVAATAAHCICSAQLRELRPCHCPIYI
jgi:hypothetical protein